MTDKLNITIRIAGQKPMTLSIDREYEETARNAEYQVNRLFGLWSERFRDKSPMEVPTVSQSCFTRRMPPPPPRRSFSMISSANLTASWWIRPAVDPGQ